ncbi:MAG: hypothetical protein KF729_31625 [Sandaracinaceae bacterium]|nr:hypothetical protein [Sandaracinaceae bacterium]
MRARALLASWLVVSAALPGSADAQARRVTVYACPGGRTVEMETRPDGSVSFRTAGPGDSTSIDGCRPAAYDAPAEDVARVASLDGRRVRVAGGGLADDQRVAWINPRNGAAVAVGRARRSVDDEGAAVTHVELGVGEVVPRDATARPTELRETADPWAPPWYGNVWQAVFGARPFLAVNDDPFGLPPFGFAPWTALRYRARIPFSISAEWDPIALTGSGLGGTDVATVAMGLLGIDTRHFEFAAGLGIATHPRQTCCGGTLQFVISQRVRFGGLDGLHVELTAVEGFDGGVTLMSLSGRAQLPLEALDVARDWWLIARGGGGAAGFGYGEVGARALVLGNGWQRSIFLTFTAGVFGMVARPMFDRLALRVGPSLSFELEARF